MNKLKVMSISALLALSVGSVPLINADAAETTNVKKSVTTEVKQSSTEEIVPFASTGWETKSGITARVYTDRTGDYPASDDWIDVTGQKTDAGGTVYYRIEIVKQIPAGWELVATQKGSFASQTPTKRFYIDNLLSKGSSGTFKVNLKIFKDSAENYWLGDWTTSSFKVYN